jgi:hypothetical protein
MFAEESFVPSLIQEEVVKYETFPTIMNEKKCKKYTIEDYTNIIFDNQYKIEESVLKKLKDLAGFLLVNTDPITQSTPIRKNAGDNFRPIKNSAKNNFKDEGITTNSWESLRSFKSTVIEKKEGLDKTIADIRIALNKISQKNYESNKTLILKNIEEVFTQEDAETSAVNLDVNLAVNLAEGQTKDNVYDQNSTTSLNKVATSIFEIASSNIFFSEIYATLYKELAEKYSIFGKILSNFLLNYVEKFNQIKVFESTDNYDDFSQYNKMNDARKATSTFIVNLVKKSVVPQETLAEIISNVQEIAFEYIDRENSATIVEEIAENLFLLLKMPLKGCEKWHIIKENIVKVTQMKPKETKSLSTRAYFKFMDILDAQK